jgi:hypothetical protein
MQGCRTAQPAMSFLTMQYDDQEGEEYEGEEGAPAVRVWPSFCITPVLHTIGTCVQLATNLTAAVLQPPHSSSACAHSHEKLLQLRPWWQAVVWRSITSFMPAHSKGCATLRAFFLCSLATLP